METLQLDICSDFQRLKAEALVRVAKCEKIKAGFDTEKHVGWTNTSVYSRQDNANNFYELSEYINRLGIDVVTARFMILEPGGIIQRHTDSFLENEIARLHLPIQTNPNAKLYINHTDASWPEGELWYGDFRLPHWGENNGDTERIHLVIDAIVDDSLRRIFGGAANQIFGAANSHQLAQVNQYSVSFILPSGLLIERLFDAPLTKDVLASIKPFHGKLYLFLDESPFLAVSVISNNRLSIEGLPLDLMLEYDFELGNAPTIVLKLETGDLHLAVVLPKM